MFDVHAGTQLLTVCGSTLYGIARAESDIDLRGFAIPPQRYYYSAIRNFEQAEGNAYVPGWKSVVPQQFASYAENGVEGVVYNISKFASLAAHCNPNILEPLFAPEEFVAVCTPIGRRFRENKNLFLSQRARSAYLGYASGQFHKIQNHRVWLRQNPSPPTREAFGLPPEDSDWNKAVDLVEAEVRKNLDEIVNPTVGLDGVPPAVVAELRERVHQFLVARNMAARPNFMFAKPALSVVPNDLIDRFRREHEWRKAKRDYADYLKWQRDRNPKRLQTEMTVGYDVKMAAHSIRLLLTGEQLLKDGELRPVLAADDAAYVLRIRNCEITYEHFLADYEARLNAVKTLKSSLPALADMQAIDDLTVEAIEECNRKSG